MMGLGPLAAFVPGLKARLALLLSSMKRLVGFEATTCLVLVGRSAHSTKTASAMAEDRRADTHAHASVSA